MIVSIVDHLSVNRDLHLTNIRNEAAYFTCISQVSIPHFCSNLYALFWITCLLIPVCLDFPEGLLQPVFTEDLSLPLFLVGIVLLNLYIEQHKPR